MRNRLAIEKPSFSSLFKFFFKRFEINCIRIAKIKKILSIKSNYNLERAEYKDRVCLLVCLFALRNSELDA